MVDHAARAERLRAFADALHKLNEECFEDAGVDLDKPYLPHRFACSQYDGSSTWIAFADTLDEAAEQEAGITGDDYPWGPADVLDLDTGARYAPEVKVTLRRYAHRVSYASHSTIGGRPFSIPICDEYTDAGTAEAVAAQARENGATDVLVEPIPAP